MNIPEQIPKPLVGKLKAFKSLEAFFDYFKSIPITDKNINSGLGTYKSIYDVTVKMSEDIIKGEREYYSNESWFGFPLLESYEQGMQRERYMRMDDFDNVYNNSIKPRLEEILKKSKAELEFPTLKYNDLGLGIFDFNKASTGLVPKYRYYSFAKEAIVEGNLVETFEIDGKFKCKLIEDGSPVVSVPFLLGNEEDILQCYKDIYKGQDVFEAIKKNNVKIGGEGAFGSIIKKSYVLKEKVLKPKNAVRIFVSIGANADKSAEQYKWSGYAAIGIAELLSILGYAVNIVGICGSRDRINIDQDGVLVDGNRFWGINLKSFEETLDAKSLLYVCSDASFFRLKAFDCIIKQADYFNDYLDSGLGYSSGIEAIENMVFTQYGKRDRLFNQNGKISEKSEFLYYIIGDVYSQEDLNKLILDIGLDVVNKNKEAREKLLGI